MGRLEGLLSQLTPDGIFARHPLRRISPNLTNCERPLQVAADASTRAGELLRQLDQTLQRAGIDPAFRGTLVRIRTLLDYLRLAAPLAANSNLLLADAADPRAGEFAKAGKRIDKSRKKLALRRKETTGWRDKLAPADARTALEQARRWDGKLLAWLSPGWWRLRRELNRRYDFSSHSVAPTWCQILDPLVQEHIAADEFESVRQQVIGVFGGERSPEELEAAAAALREAVVRLPEWLRPFHDGLKANPLRRRRY